MKQNKKAKIIKGLENQILIVDWPTTQSNNNEDKIQKTHLNNIFISISSPQHLCFATHPFPQFYLHICKSIKKKKILNFYQRKIYAQKYSITKKPSKM
jgi:hypothetical protein